MKFDFATEQFGINGEGIHFLRSGYCFKSVSLSSIKEVEIRNGIRVKNRSGLTLLALVSLSGAVYLLSKKITLDRINGFRVQGGRFLWFVIMLIISLMVLAGVSLYQAHIFTKILEVKTYDGERFVFSLYKEKKSNQLPALEKILQREEYRSKHKTESFQRL